MPRYGEPLKVYISYSHRDTKLVEQILASILPLQRDGFIRIWYDRHLPAGTNWQDTINRNLESADIILLMVSPNYLASDFCYNLEMPKAMERVSRGEVYVIPIILSKCHWYEAPFNRLVALPTNAKPITQWRKREDAVISVTEGIRQTVNEIVNRLSSDAIDDGEQMAATKGEATVAGPNLQGKTLIIHGHAEQNRYELRDFLQNRLGLPIPIVMADEFTVGMTLPQKFQYLADQVEFAIAILTPDDKGKAIGDQTYHQRARQNVLIEIGWFWGKLGLERMLLLVKDQVEIPSDLQGLEYYRFSRNPVECSEKIRALYRAHSVLIN